MFNQGPPFSIYMEKGGVDQLESYPSNLVRCPWINSIISSANEQGESLLSG